MQEKIRWTHGTTPGDNKYGRNATQNPGGGCVSIHGARLATFQYVYILSKINVRGKKVDIGIG